ncbi:MAG: hypothetical protein EON89_13370 [Brevundimonas sp.]|nr:MAG: hypothetical protein EON89_13370 [Brevundimonas sp.]
MAGPGDPDTPDDHDDHVGFSSPASLEGQHRAAQSQSQGLQPPVFQDPDPDLFDPAPPRAAPAAAPTPAGSIFEPSVEFQAREQRRHAPPAEPAALPGGGVMLYAIYALILLTVPTFCAAGLLGLLAVWRQPGPQDALSQSHFIYQKRTLMVGAATAVAGVILLAFPFALGVPLLFLLFIWLVLRGASGVWALKSGRAIAHPLGWWI